MERRLGGDAAWRRSPPGALPRFCPALPAAAMQEAIVECLAQVAPSAIDDVHDDDGPPSSMIGDGGDGGGDGAVEAVSYRLGGSGRFDNP